MNARLRVASSEQLLLLLQHAVEESSVLTKLLLEPARSPSLRMPLPPLYLPSRRGGRRRRRGRGGGGLIDLRSGQGVWEVGSCGEGEERGSGGGREGGRGGQSHPKMGGRRGGGALGCGGRRGSLNGVDTNKKEKEIRI